MAESANGAAGESGCFGREPVARYDKVVVEPDRRLAEAIPAARVELIPRCGHCPQIEQPDLLGRILTEFPEVPAGPVRVGAYFALIRLAASPR